MLNLASLPRQLLAMASSREAGRPEPLPNVRVAVLSAPGVVSLKRSSTWLIAWAMIQLPWPRTEALALHFLGVDYKIVATSECDANVRRLRDICHAYVKKTGSVSLADMTNRAPFKCDLYVGTAPCQDFSSAGGGKGHLAAHHRARAAALL